MKLIGFLPLVVLQGANLVHSVGEYGVCKADYGSAFNIDHKELKEVATTDSWKGGLPDAPGGPVRAHGLALQLAINNPALFSLGQSEEEKEEEEGETSNQGQQLSDKKSSVLDTESQE